AFGARVEFTDGWCGIVASESGTLSFTWAHSVLCVRVMEDQGHFPSALIIGGIKQTVEEANEIVRRAASSRIVITGSRALGQHPVEDARTGGHAETFNPSVT